MKEIQRQIIKLSWKDYGELRNRKVSAKEKIMGTSELEKLKEGEYVVHTDTRWFWFLILYPFRFLKLFFYHIRYGGLSLMKSPRRSICSSLVSDWWEETEEFKRIDRYWNERVGI